MSVSVRPMDTFSLVDETVVLYLYKKRGPWMDELSLCYHLMSTVTLKATVTHFKPDHKQFPGLPHEANARLKCYRGDIRLETL